MSPQETEMITEETVFKTSDGKPFINDKEGAEKHQSYLNAMKPGDDYEKALKANGWQDGPALTRQINVVKDYLGYMETGNAPLPPEAKVKPPVDEKPKGKPAGEKGEEKKEK